MTWALPSRPNCYLKMFPDPLNGGHQKGQVFNLSELDSRTQAVVQAGLDQWEQCRECYYYRTCYDFGFARMLLFQITQTESGIAPPKDSGNQDHNA